MTATTMTAFWSMTINNPDERDLALVRNGYADYCRELIHTLEVGEQGTPHIQAWVKLQRQQRMSFMKKLFPGGHFKALTSAEYVANTKMYAQKDDDTTAGAHVHVFHDPTDTIESIVKKVALRILEDKEDLHISVKRARVQKAMVTEDYRHAKMFVGAAYKAMWSKYEQEIMECVKNLAHTHTHTHTEEESSVDIDITEEDGEGDDDNQEGEGEAESVDWEVCQGNEDSSSETDEGSGESSSDQSDEEDASSEYGE